jgi:drug/metabolite transporter (DMT)-like permease
MDRSNLLAGLMAAMAAAFVGSAWQLISRHGVTTTLGPMELALLRYGIPALLLSPLWFGRKARIPPNASRTALVLFVIGGGLPFGLLVLAGARWAPASHMGIFMAGSLPLFTAVGAWLHKGQKVGGIRLLGLACIAAGMVLFATGSFRSGSLDWRGDLLFLAAAMLWAIHSLAFAHCGFTPRQGAAFVNGWSSLLLLPVLCCAGAPKLLSAPWPDVALQAVGQGVVAGLLGLVVYMVAVARLGASRASLSAALVPVLTTLGAAYWMDEPVTGAVLLALALVVPGVVLASGAVRFGAKTTRPLA